MKNHRALSLSFLPAFGAALLLAAPAAAQQTECQPDDLLCAEVRIGPGRAGIRIRGARRQPPPPVVVQPPPPPPQPPVVIVQPAPPPPPPQQVVVQPVPPPPPPVVVRQPVYRPRQVVTVRTVEDRYPASSTGLVLHLDGLAGDDLGMVGGGGAFRIRPNPYFAIDLGAGFYGGNDYNGMDRFEVPVTADALFFFNPQHRFQFYALVGVGASFGYADGVNIRLPGGPSYQSRSYVHLGGEAGLGVEWRLGRHFAISFDVRGFIREQINDDGNGPEFRELSSSGNQLSTNTSGGFDGRLGMTFYFGD